VSNPYDVDGLRTKLWRLLPTKQEWDEQLAQEYRDEINSPSEADRILGHALGVAL
jgi:hypothetical protein